MIIVGSGPSAKGFIPPVTQTVIAVNGAIDWLPEPDLWFTLDPSEANIFRMRNQRAYTSYHLAIERDRHHEFEGINNLNLLNRIASVQAAQVIPTDIKSPEWAMWRWSAKPGLSEVIGCIHTGNSMYGALGLAYQLIRLEPGVFDKRIVLVGLDGTQAPRIEGGLPNNLAHLPLLFESALPQLKAAGIEVVNASPESLITCFPIMSHKEALQWLTQSPPPASPPK